MEFRPEHVDAYKAQRRNGAGTARRVKVGETAIRRELEVLNRAFTYAVERKVLTYAPFIEKPTEDNVRERKSRWRGFRRSLRRSTVRTRGTSASGCS